MSEVRVESDSMGTIEVPANHYWGAQTERSLHHFAIGHETMPPALIRAFGILKFASAQVNRDLGKLDAERAVAHRAGRARGHRRRARRTSSRCGSGRPVRAPRPT